MAATKAEAVHTHVKQEVPSPEPEPKPPTKRPRRIKTDDISQIKPDTTPDPPFKSKQTPSTVSLQARKLKLYTQHNHQSPFPTFPHPTPEECNLALRILTSLHGPHTRPSQPIASPTVAGCGASPSVLDALVRTILSQNTSSANSSRAYRSLVQTYGTTTTTKTKTITKTSPTLQWPAIVSAGQPVLEAAIRSGGLARVKSRVILALLDQVHARHGIYSLDHLHQAASADEAMSELLSFKGVGPKTASCVLLFCLGRESFAVDTHVWRITGLLGWRPEGATRDETHLHLDVRIPDECKYGLHVLMVTHGRKCAQCKAGGGRRPGKEAVGGCPLQEAFPVSGEDGGENGDGDGGKG